mmetsp:Transcript_7704/g.14201  ORF Transcript_7704/g.14201 Transcript_7704/m.14201 type:complete len:458 (-) Transcript_7704:39-1412(-)|eukprot:CAMPEP_0203761162 /NCGR_PEP_ID=MMETSP0098-20131031/14313_1 /ASSEMBLY_ACC=CAM_ASM_000208 /TAXON_ID=96639 /ORGANISM=" , Strain NY0313808BC1" /LENGTH=457 /DNA_ID=CAMNT_0050655043 /DNA_START=105 /DNA_END=1478 /DNA_ORIENTATION=-
MGDYVGGPANRREYTAEELGILKQNLVRHKKVFRIQMALLDQKKINVAFFNKCLMAFQQMHLDEVAEERSLNNKCGYPLCSRKPDKNVGKLRCFVDSDKERILDAEVVARFCSLQCHDLLEVCKVQLPVASFDRKIDIPLPDGYVEPNTADHEKQAVKVACEPPPPAVESVIVENKGPQHVSENFPKAGSKADPYLVEGYRSVPVKEDEVLKQDTKQRKKKSSSFKARPKAIQEEDLASKDKHIVHNEKENFEKDNKEPKTVTFKEGPVEDEDTLEQSEEEQGGEDEEDELEEFLDFSDLKDDLMSMDFSTMMKLMDALNTWDQPQVGSEDATDVGRLQVLNKSLIRAGNLVADKMVSPDLTKTMIGDILRQCAQNFNIDRPVPSLGSREWQLLAACLLGGCITNGKIGSLDKTVLLPLLEKTVLKDISAKTARLDKDEFQSLVLLISTMRCSNCIE